MMYDEFRIRRLRGRYYEYILQVYICQFKYCYFELVKGKQKRAVDDLI